MDKKPETSVSKQLSSSLPRRSVQTLDLASACRVALSLPVQSTLSTASEVTRLNPVHVPRM